MALRCAAVILLGLTIGISIRAQAPRPAGHVIVVSGDAVVVRGDQTLGAVLGAPVMEGDTLRTGADGRLGVTLRDDTRLSLDPDSEIRLEQFAYVPSESRLGTVVRMIRGLMAYVSGQIARLSPDAVRLETPTATVGIRGTTVILRVVAAQPASEPPAVAPP